MTKMLLAGAMVVSMSAFSQTTLFEDDFEAGGGNWTLNTGGSGSNQWIVNAAYTGWSGFVDDTPPQPAGITSPNSYYLHIYNQPACSGLSVCNATFDTGSSSNRTADLSGGIDATGYGNVTLSFWYLSDGEAGSAFGTVEYSTDNGSSWTSTGTNYQGITTWTQESVSLPAWTNQSALKFRFRWQNGSSGSDPAFAVDDVKVTGVTGSFASIATGSVNPASWCFNNTANISVPFTVTGTVDAGNVYTAQLSDAAGSFASPTTIGTLASTSTGSLSVNAVVPAGTAVGSGYRIRVVASSPATTGTDNGTNLEVLALPNIQILPNPVDGIMCPGESVSMLASGGVAYQWTPTAGLDNAAAAQVTASPAATTPYTVTGTSASGCENSATFTVTVDDCAGIGENTAAAFVLFPNPASETVSISYLSELEATSVQLLDNSGRLVASFQGTVTELSVSDLPAGSYIVRINHDAGTSVARFTRR